jgi:CoB--CoM heterodisulfide reductase subunit B
MVYANFWGCMIPARIPFIEKSTRLVMDKLGVRTVDINGFTCCPEKQRIDNLDEELWLLTAARNMGVAEKEGLDIITPCTGCNSSLNNAAAQLNRNPWEKKHARETLGKQGLDYRGETRVKQFLEVLHDEVSPKTISEKSVKSFRGVTLALHYGCHMMRPSSGVHFDHPLLPTKMDALVEALGARSLKYPSKMDCCGQALGAVEEEALSMEMMWKKLVEVQEMGADALVVCCPACFIQFDYGQNIAQRQGIDVAMPILYLSELIGLALGFSSEELGVTMHRSDTSSFFEKWDSAIKRFAKIEEHFDLEVLEHCYNCRACTFDVCPVAKSAPDYVPYEIIGALLEGKLDEVIRDGKFWKCLECNSCYEMCPQKASLWQTFGRLKNLSIERGLQPDAIKKGIDSFKKTGVLVRPNESQRKKLGLTKTVKTDIDSLKKLFK